MPPDTLPTVHPAWVHTALNPWNSPDFGWVITIFWVARILPPPTGTSDVLASAAGAASTSDIPVGGGKILTDKKIVITQPGSGTFRAFSAVCTHAGCTVGSVSGGTINCPCHGSRFNITNGSVVNGPAASPLPPVSIKVQGNSIVQA